MGECLLCQRACPYRCFWNPVTHWSALCIAHLYVLRAQICVCQLIDYELFSAAVGWFHCNALDVSTAKSNTFSHANLNSQARRFVFSLFFFFLWCVCVCALQSHHRYGTIHDTVHQLKVLLTIVDDCYSVLDAVWAEVKLSPCAGVHCDCDASLLQQQQQQSVGQRRAALDGDGAGVWTCNWRNEAKKQLSVTAGVYSHNKLVLG